MKTTLSNTRWSAVAVVCALLLAFHTPTNNLVVPQAKAGIGPMLFMVAVAVIGVGLVIWVYSSDNSVKKRALVLYQGDALTDTWVPVATNIMVIGPKGTGPTNAFPAFAAQIIADSAMFKVAEIPIPQNFVLTNNPASKYYAYIY
jgi:hypothetical protein